MRVMVVRVGNCINCDRVYERTNDLKEIKA